ncbi:hypothetical protein [Lysobacter claricitrinus]|uniref:hypothetical protein n=1 Tax=Lysobacter claricitrinus TaxID=3367728 RepID=UPI0037DA9738
MTFDIDSLRDTLATVPVGAWCAVAAVLVLQRFARRLGLWLYAAFALPGTLAHELAHYVVALALGAQPRLPRLWPERTGTGWRLGAVAFRATWWRAGPIALAPLLLLPGALAWVVMFLADARGVAIALHAWVAGTLLGAALPSRADLRIAAPTLAVIAFVTIVAVAVRLLA